MYAEPPDSSSNIRLYSKRAIAVAAVLGGPIGGAILFYKNFQALRMPCEGAKPTIGLFQQPR